ncbi:MAG: hypothetical protein JKY56_23250 [Kofleriaceae bacterium]|nr:hypothetical protein [Kofleriaceae bacterium]
MRSILTALLAGTIGLTLASTPALAQETPDKPAAPATATPATATPATEATPAAEEEEEEAPETPAAPTGPSEEDMVKAKDHFMKGRELFDAKDFESAVDEFKESYKLSKNSVLLYNIAFTHDEIGDKQMATFYYEKFLRDTKKGVANRDVAKKRLRVLKKESAGTDTEPAVTVTAFKHSVVDESPPNTPLDIVATVPEGVPWRVIVNYRPAGEPKFIAVEMRYRFKELVARTPAKQTRGKNVQYYIEVRDGSGKVLERSGQPTSPHIVYMELGAKPRYYADSTTGPIVATAGPTDITSGPSDTGNSDGGWLDPGSAKFDKLKWGTTGTAVGLIAASTVFYLVSANYSSELEKEALQSRAGSCPTGPPCKQFAQKQKDLLSLGGTYETLGTVALGLGIASAAAAGALWYLDISSEEKETNTLTTIPVVGNDYIGAAASLRF